MAAAIKGRQHIIIINDWIVMITTHTKKNWEKKRIELNFAIAIYFTATTTNNDDEFSLSINNNESLEFCLLQYSVCCDHDDHHH